eukprot:714925-Pyramimonas_sp.AAC.1
MTRPQAWSDSCELTYHFADVHRPLLQHVQVIARQDGNADVTANADALIWAPVLLKLRARP